ncbi:MAG: ribosome silencing factor [Gammaproteobacteria bacterium]|nr:ribosome silencing factor [Gammaproteobacteria bacterium]
MTASNLHDRVLHALEEMKARDIKELDVSDLTSVTELMVIASGTSNRHVKSLADKVIESAREGGDKPLGVEGADEGEWVLVDLDEIVVHVMLPRVRDFYNLEKLWASTPGRDDREARRGS